MFWPTLLDTPLALAILWYCLRITRDYRLRRRFSDATAHLDLADLKAGYATNIKIVAGYLQNRPRPKGSLRRAEAALIMATVLREHIVAKEGLLPAPTHLRSRRELWRRAKRMPKV